MFKKLTVKIVVGLLLVSSVLPVIPAAHSAFAQVNPGEASLEFASHGEHPALSPNGKVVFVGKGRPDNNIDNEYLVGMYDVKSGSLLKEIPSNNSSDWYDYSPNGKYLVSTGSYINFLDGTSGEQLFSLPYYYANISFQKTNDQIAAISYSSTSSLFDNDTLVLYNLETKTKLFEKNYPAQKSIRVAMHPTLPIVAVSYGLNVEIIDYSTGRVIDTIKNPFNLQENQQMFAFKYLLYSPDGDKLSLISDLAVTEPFKQYDVNNGYNESFINFDAYVNEREKVRENLPNKISYSPNGFDLFLHYYGKINVYDVKTGKYKSTITGDLNTVVFSQDMKKIAYTRNDRVATGESPKYVLVKDFPFLGNKEKRIEFKDPYIQLRQGNSTYYGLEYINSFNQRTLLEPKDVKLEPFDDEIIEISAANKIIAKNPGSTIVKATYNGLVDYLSIEVQSLAKSKIIVDPLYDSSVTITGKAPANITLYAMLGSREYRVLTNSDGSFKVDLDKPLKANSFVWFMYQLDELDANLSGGDYLFENVIRDTVAPSPPKVTTVNEETGVMQGTAEPNATISVSSETVTNAFSALSTSTLSVKASRNGTFKVKVLFTQFNGQLLKTTAKDLVGNKSKATSTKLSDHTPPNKPTINPHSNIATTVTGKAEAGSYIYVNKGSKRLGKGKTSSNGKYSIKISKYKTGTILTVYSVDAAKNRSKTATIKVVKAPKTPTINSITRRTVKVSGKTDPYTMIYIKKGSTVLVSGKTTRKGIYSLRLPKQKAGQILTVIAKSKQGVYSYARRIKVK